MEKEKQLVTKMKAAEMLGISRSTLDRYIKRNVIQEHASGLRTKIKISDIEELKKTL